ncbi:TcmI family type II polyketide cyclase [Actinoalloteichus sp. AHMU CJ021]|uniref:Cyclase n=2 Tax=Actinoalloteichus cyanogriseus TaxID=2893586 RepID=A0ABT1JFG7_ACTCY|nr:TcmI family type II polyketide cyclase [Actinoalloteichus caeruleus]AUS77412.1 TcmI family type II polyketide cyclase [Actinoalloteichus sp. AHMU CJ021]MCP2331239.1 cyclase [Actinoalloteichus caeruleus DSM 43889]
MWSSLIVARLRTDDTSQIADAFAASDATELPHMVGVARRTLFTFHDLYFHLILAEQDIWPALYRARQTPLYQRVNTDLSSLVSAYDPNWKEPKDAVAQPFYTWTAQEGRIQ